MSYSCLENQPSCLTFRTLWKILTPFCRQNYKASFKENFIATLFSLLGRKLKRSEDFEVSLGFVTMANLIRNHANSCCSLAAFPHRLYYSSLTSPTALNDVMGSAAQRDERDKAEPAGTGESFQHTIHNTAWELKSYRSSHSTPSISESCAFSQHKQGMGEKS